MTESILLHLEVDDVSLGFGGADVDVKGVHNGLPVHMSLLSH